MSYNAAIHGSFSAHPSISHSQQPQPPFGNGYYPNVPPQTIQRECRLIDAYTTLQAKLDKKLGPEFISPHLGPGGQGKLTYPEGWEVINLTNEVFGFNGGSGSIPSLAVDYMCTD